MSNNIDPSFIGIRDIFRINNKSGDGQFAKAWGDKYSDMLDKASADVLNLAELKEPYDACSLNHYRACLATINAISIIAFEAKHFFESNAVSKDEKLVNAAIETLCKKVERFDNGEFTTSKKQIMRYFGKSN